MFTANTGMIASRFLENGIASYGTLTSSLKRPPERSNDRKRAEQSIIKLAKAEGISIGQMIHKVLSQSIPELNSYVQFHGEAPSSDIRKLAIQSAMLRAHEIGTISKALDVTDEEAQNILSESEQEHTEDNDAETSYILSPSTEAAICLLVYRMADRFKDRGGSGQLRDFVTTVRRATNSGDFDNISMGWVVNNFSGGGGVNNAGGSGIIYTPEQEQEITGGVTQTDAPKSSWWDNLFSGIDKVVDGITKVSGAVQTTVGNVQQTSGSIIDQITNIGGQVGSKSIDNYLKENWLKILGVVVVLIIFTVLIVRIGRK
jgi:hypothetical protein